MKRQRLNQRGVSLVAAIFIIVILAFLGLMFATLLGTGTSAAVNEMQSLRALALAEGGLEYALQAGAYCSYAAAGVPLGEGSFDVASQFLQTTLTNSMTPASTTIDVATAANFRVPGTVAVDGEYVFCAGRTGTQFFGCIRPWAGSTPAAHAVGSSLSQCVVTSTGRMPTGFASAGITRTVQATVGE